MEFRIAHLTSAAHSQSRADRVPRAIKAAMKTQNRLFWLGLLIYVASFFLTAVAGSGIVSVSYRGYYCAYLSLVAPWGEDYRNSLTQAVPLEISGWINVVFWAAVLLILRETHQRLIRGPANRHTVDDPVFLDLFLCRADLSAGRLFPVDRRNDAGPILGSSHTEIESRWSKGAPDKPYKLSFAT